MKDSQYCPPFPFGNGHVQTIYPVLFRKTPSLVYTRERITTPDKDFLDLDWSTPNWPTPDGSAKARQRLVIISHGLEGNTTRNYVKGMVRAVNEGGWDCLAWNYRSCSGEPNRQLRSYHNGATDDLALVIDHAKKKRRYQEIALVGFSLGGNLTLVHLGRDLVDPLVKKAVVFSVPCDLAASTRALEKPSNAFYMKRFLVMLHQKIKEKMAIMPHALDDRGYVGFVSFNKKDLYWSEQQTVFFLNRPR